MKKLFNRKRILVLLWLVVLSLGTGQLILANEISTQGGEVVRLEAKHHYLEEQVVSLRQETSALGSLARIQEEAQKLGFVSNPQALDFIEAPKLAKLR